MTDEPAPGWTVYSLVTHIGPGGGPGRTWYAQDFSGRRVMSRHRHDVVRFTHDHMAWRFGWHRRLRTFDTHEHRERQTGPARVNTYDW